MLQWLLRLVLCDTTQEPCCSGLRSPNPEHTPKNRLQPDGSTAEFTSDSLLVSDALVNLSEFCIDCHFSTIIGGLTEIKPWYDPLLYGLLS